MDGGASMLVDYHTHLLGHQDREGSEDDIREFLREAEKNGVKEIAFTDHNRYHEEFDFNKIKKVAREFEKVKVLTGIEMDYTAGKEKEIAEFLNNFELDLAIGSIHFLDGWMYDHPDYKDQYDDWDSDELYEYYFEQVNQLVESNLFEIVGHLDLIKIFNYRPNKDILEIVTPTLKLIAENEMVMEINTNGMNKPVKEFYPERKVVEKAYELGVKVTMSSDAHRAERIGENLKRVRKELLEIGYREIATFENRKRKMKKL
jgi:histidinol-phosphatase (PHP family)